MGKGMLIPTSLNRIAAITPKQFLGRASGGFSVALNLGQFDHTPAAHAVLKPVRHPSPAKNNSLPDTIEEWGILGL